MKEIAFLNILVRIYTRTYVTETKYNFIIKVEKKFPVYLGYQGAKCNGKILKNTK